MNLPTKLTVLRIVLIPVFVALYFVKFPFNGIAAVAVFMIACFTDFLDGHLARKWNQVTTLGKFLDPDCGQTLGYVRHGLRCYERNRRRNLYSYFGNLSYGYRKPRACYKLFPHDCGCKRYDYASG